MGDRIYLDYTTGSVVDGYQTVATVPTTNTFTVNSSATTTTSGNVTVYPPLIITANGHGLSTNNITYLDFASTFTDAELTVYQATSNTFQVSATPATTSGVSGNVTLTMISGLQTWTKPTGCRKVLVKLVGGGGGTSSSSTQGTGSGGGYSEKFINVESISTVDVRVGGAGRFVTADTNTGGNSSFGIYLSASGGAGGASSTPAAPGAGSNGDINISGGLGFNSGTSFYGGGSQLGRGGFSGSVTSISANGYGAGGSYYDDGAGSVLSAAGTPGIVIVTEYY